MSNNSRLRSMGLVDLHFHGAFGIDLMTADKRQMERLGRLLWKRGVAGFCVTTLSVPSRQLEATVSRMGDWISSFQAEPSPLGAVPLGIHLEGPFISPKACGAHPPSSIRPLDFDELDRLWKVSRGTLKILTIAPETLSSGQTQRLVRWAAPRGVVLSMGHSQATLAQARKALQAGFSGVTHAWNAMRFHQRDPGILGAVLGNEQAYAELIIDGVHVAPEVVRWTHELHPRTCFVSDCVPAGETGAGSWHSFGDLRIRYQDGACRLKEGHLAGGGRVLSEMYRRWLLTESKRTGETTAQLLNRTLPSVTKEPVRALGLSPRVLSQLRARTVQWHLEHRRVRIEPKC